MIWIIGIVATVLFIAGLSVYAYRLALEEGLEAEYAALPILTRMLIMVWRGFVMMAAVGLVFSIIIAVWIASGPVTLIVKAISPSLLQKTLHFVAQLAFLAIIFAGSVFYLVEIRESYLGYLAWIPVGWAGLGLAGTLIGFSVGPDPSDRPKKSSLPLSERLAKLGKCGIHVRLGISLDEMRKADPNGFLDVEGYDGIVMIMGGYGKSLDEETFSDDVWYNDIECITQPEDYARVARHLRRLSRGDFAIENVRAETDEDGAEVALKFTLQGKEYDLWAPLGDDMMDVEVWAELQGLFISCCKEGRRLEQVVYGQDGCYFYITPEQKACLKKLGLVFFT